MSDWAIRVYKQLYMLETYSKQYYILEADNVSILDDMIETNKFVTISWARINVTNISSYYPIPSNEIYDFIIALPEAVRQTAIWILKQLEKDKIKEHSSFNISHLIRVMRSIFKFPSEYDSEEFETYSNFIISYLHSEYKNNK